MTIAERSIAKKLKRFRLGERLRVLDLFSGCGGISLGFHAAGYEIVAAVESDPDAARSHGTNFHPGDERHSRWRDITQTSPAQLCEELALGTPADAVDVIVGGPPCQAFARVGRSKLREVADHPEAFRHDQRARLYIKYLEYVTECAPLAVVMENVPDMLNHGGHNLAAEICEVLSEKGYACGYAILNAAFYGVPQMRERMILIAIRRELADDIRFPSPTHWIELPSGYSGSRAVALKLLSGNSNDPHFKASPQPAPNLAPAVTVAQALDDLPAIMAREEMKAGTLKRGARRLDAPISYAGQALASSYGRQMREWKGFEGGPNLTDHVIRYLPRDYELFARLKPGDEYPEALATAEMMFKEALQWVAAETGKRPRAGSKQWKELRAAIVPPYDPSKFPNKWRKMEADTPSRTLLAHLGKDSYSHIHYDSSQARTISVREAARLQSFPDGFKFCGTMNPAFRQIGNAVPPLLAQALAQSLLSQMTATLSAPAAAPRRSANNTGLM